MRVIFCASSGHLAGFRQLCDVPQPPTYPVIEFYVVMNLAPLRKHKWIKVVTSATETVSLNKLYALWVFFFAIFMVLLAYYGHLIVLWRLRNGPRAALILTLLLYCIL